MMQKKVDELVEKLKVVIEGLDLLNVTHLRTNDMTITAGTLNARELDVG